LQAPIYLVAPGVTGFGLTRIAVTIEHPKDNVTVLRATTPPRAGWYAVLCGKEAFELTLR
jgi:hypothetical protein